MNYENLSDLELIQLIKNDDDKAKDFILNKYKNIVVIKARTFYLSGGDYEDVIQEGMIGLFKAIYSYKVEGEASFETFASLCITRQIYTAIKNANRQKHAPLNNSYSLNILEDTNDKLLAKVAESPENIIINNEDVFVLEEKIENVLTDLENQVLKLYLSGLNYEEISKEINKNEKSVDNALSRIRKKIMSVL